MNSAITLIIKNRFFVGWGKSQRLKTAWSLAGATLYLPDIHYYEKDLIRLQNKGHIVEIREVQS